MTALPVSKIAAFVFLLMFFWVEVAEARLYRTGGRGTRADVYSEAFYYVNNTDLNSTGIIPSYTTWGQAYLDTSKFSGSASQSGGVVGIDAVPTECVNGYSRLDEEAADDEIADLERHQANFDPSSTEYQDIDAEIQAINAQFANDPCIWEFEYGEDLFTWGSFFMHFGNPEVDYDVTWHISGNGNNWRFGGSLNADPNLTDPNDPNYSIPVHSVILDTPPPVELTPGDYDIFVSVDVSSDDGQFFYTSSEPDNEVTFSEFCLENPAHDTWLIAESAYNGNDYDGWLAQNPEPDYEICGFHPGRDTFDPVYEDLYYAYKERVYASTSFWSPVETLRIIPSTVQSSPVISTNAPSTFGLFLLSIMIILRERR